MLHATVLFQKGYTVSRVARRIRSEITGMDMSCELIATVKYRMCGPELKMGLERFKTYLYGKINSTW